MTLGSRSTYVLGALGGFEGRPLAEGDELTVGSAIRRADRVACPRSCAPAMPKELEIRVVMGLYDHLLTDAGRRHVRRDRRGR